MNILFTNHARAKMAHYKLSPSLVKRAIRYPDRTETAILAGTVGAMKTKEVTEKGEKVQHEVWVMYVPADGRKTSVIQVDDSAEKIDPKRKGLLVITAWIYPGTSPERDPVPEQIWEEIEALKFT